jgi:hypothetical protein
LGSSDCSSQRRRPPPRAPPREPPNEVAPRLDAPRELDIRSADGLREPL